jgi:hypothetical protein
LLNDFVGDVNGSKWSCAGGYASVPTSFIDLSSVFMGNAKIPSCVFFGHWKFCSGLVYAVVQVVTAEEICVNVEQLNATSSALC